MSVSSPNTSASLLDRARDCANAEAWERLVKLYAPLLRVWLASLRLQAADADDVAQRVLQILVSKLPEFRHNGRPGAFRAWLRGITANLLREHFRSSSRRNAVGEDILEQLEDPNAELSRQWDLEHDRHVLHGLLELVRPEFTAPSWEAFRRQVLDNEPASRVASELGLSVNAVLVAKSRVLSRLRREAHGLIEK